MPSLRILVVDDDPVVLASCRRVLGAEGHQVTCSSSVVEALEILEKQEFDLLLVDVIMPGYDGIQLIGKVRGSQGQAAQSGDGQSGARMPILVMSGYPTSETISSGMRVGATHFIAKPFTPQELLTAVGKAVRADDDVPAD